MISVEEIPIKINKTQKMEETIASNILQTIGNTPLVKLSKIVPEYCADIYVKLEYFNLKGPIKTGWR